MKTLAKLAAPAAQLTAWAAIACGFAAAAGMPVAPVLVGIALWVTWAALTN